MLKNFLQVQGREGEGEGRGGAREGEGVGLEAPHFIKFSFSTSYFRKLVY